MVTVLEFLKSMWTNHKQKILAFLIGVLLTVIASVSGMPIADLKNILKDAVNEPVPVTQTTTITAPVSKEQPKK